MRTFIARIAAIVVAAALLAGCASAGATAPPSAASAASPSPSPSPSPAAVTPTPAPTTDGEGPEHVVGTITSVKLTQQYETTYAPGGLVKQLRNGVVEFGFEMNDPRVTGTGTWGPVAVDVYGDSLGPEWGTFALANAAGSWTGSCAGGTWANGEGAADGCWLVGQDGYAGWTTYLQFAKEPSGLPVVTGVIYPGAPPKP